MERAKLLEQLRSVEYDVSYGARLVANQQNAIRALRKYMRDVAGADELLIDLECAQAVTLNQRDRLRRQLAALTA
jgi:hypothetical protein